MIPETILVTGATGATGGETVHGARESMLPLLPWIRLA
jgi:hypothetical protein